MTVNVKDLPIYNLKINELERFTTPYNSELGSGEEDKSPQSKFGKHARLLYQSLLEKIVETAFRLGIPLGRSRGQVIDLFTKKSMTCPSDLLRLPSGRQRTLNSSFVKT